MSNPLKIGYLFTFPSGKISIGDPAEPASMIRVESPGTTNHCIVIDRYSGQPSIKAISGGTGSGWLLFGSNGSPISVNHYSSNDVHLCYGGGNVVMGAASPQNITSGSDLTLTGMIANEGWIAPTLLNNWQNYAVSVYNSAAYFRDKNGFVHLRGLVRYGTANTIFQLPDGYRPTHRLLKDVCTNPNVIGRVEIYPASGSGNVDMYAGDTGWFSLDGVMFRAEGY